MTPSTSVIQLGVYICVFYRLLFDFVRLERRIEKIIAGPNEKLPNRAERCEEACARDHGEEGRSGRECVGALGGIKVREY